MYEDLVGKGKGPAGSAPAGRGPQAKAGSPNREAGVNVGIDAVTATNSPTEAAKAFKKATSEAGRSEGTVVRLLPGPETPMTAKQAWNGGFGRPGEPPLAWTDRYENLYVDSERVNVEELLTAGVDEGAPNFDPLPDLE
jgi:hypothetical protein